MKTTFTILASLFCSTLLIAGCAATKEPLKAKGTGLARVYRVPYEAVWQKVPGVLASVDATLKAKDESEGYFLADTPGGSGDSLVVFVTRIDDKSTKVEVVAIRKFAIPFFQQNWEEKTLNKFEEDLFPKTTS